MSACAQDHGEKITGKRSQGVTDTQLSCKSGRVTDEAMGRQTLRRCPVAVIAPREAA
jgi:hypothetical protein